jgi:hypothetical protein
MKDRTIWAFLAFALLVLGGIYLLRSGPSKSAPVTTTAPASATLTTGPVAAPASSPTTAASTPARASTTATGPELQLGRNGQRIPIQDGKTIDMSSGRPVVQDDARSRATIEKAVREMEEAAKSVTFRPTPAPAEKKKEEPPPVPKS